jgi:hypothetical protein
VLTLTQCIREADILLQVPQGVDKRNRTPPTATLFNMTMLPTSCYRTHTRLSYCPLKTFVARSSNHVFTSHQCMRETKQGSRQNSVLRRSHHMIHVILIQLTVIIGAQLDALLSTSLRHSLNSSHSSARRLSSCVDELGSPALGL